MSFVRWWGLPALLVLAAACPAAESDAARAAVERHHKEKSPAWADGETLTFFHQGEAERVEVIFGGDMKELKRLPDSDVWTLAVTRPGLGRAVFSYLLTPVRKGGPPEGTPAEPRVWRGPLAPPAPAECAEFRGKLETFTVTSKALSAERKVTVYLPPGADQARPARVVYAADGQGTDGYARVLEPLVAAGALPPVVIVGVHSGSQPDFKAYDREKDFRLQEYFPGINPRRFADHEAFFCREVPAWAEGRFGVSARREDRAVFGCSNGGQFAVEMGLRHPDLFGHVLGFSVAGKLPFDLGPEAPDPPQFHLSAGTWEKHFLRPTAGLAHQLADRGVRVAFTTRVGGHDAALWREEFVAALLRAYGDPPAKPARGHGRGG
jgi:enterochelin esterase-like enzyme